MLSKRRRFPEQQPSDTSTSLAYVLVHPFASVIGAATAANARCDGGPGCLGIIKIIFYIFIFVV